MCAPNHNPQPSQFEEDEFRLGFLSLDDSAPEPPPVDFPRYSPTELAALFLDFYRFLTTLHYKPADLKVPPPEGWGQLIPDCYAEFKSARTIEVLRRLPYLKSNENAAIHYKSHLRDYTSLNRDFFEKDNWEDKYIDDSKLENSEGDPVGAADVILIAEGYESGGRQFLLDVNSGEITEDEIRCNTFGPYDVKEFLKTLIEDHRTLRLIPYPGNLTTEAYEVPEHHGIITEAEVGAQSETWWGTDLDWQYIRQIYRSYGWPDAFRRDEAFKAVEELLDKMDEIGRESWEGEAHDF